MSVDIKSESQRLNETNGINHIDNSQDPSTPQDEGPRDLAQTALPTTEVPASPIDLNQSFRTEVNDDRLDNTIIPSSLTPPPSTQVEPVNGNNSRWTLPRSQQSNLVSPPATIMNILKERDSGSEYVLPEPQEIADATTDELRHMLQTCVAEHQRFKTETAHYRLQYNLLHLQAEDDAARAEVEHEMLRREIDALRAAEHSRQAKRELSTFSDTMQTKYMDMKERYEAAVGEAHGLMKQLKKATKIIQQKEEELDSASDERDQLLTRIRENREHMYKLCSPGGIFHGALTPKQHGSPSQHRVHRHNPRQLTTEDSRGLSTLLEAMSQDNNSAPSTPLVPTRSIGARPVGRHQRNAQSLSSLPTTPISRPRGPGLLPSASLVPLTEPPKSYSVRHYQPATPTTSRPERRKSRESTISVDGEDTEELARQALRVSQASRSFDLPPQSNGSQRSHEGHDPDVFDSEASQAATEMLRRDPRQSFEVRTSQESQGPERVHGAVERSSGVMQAKLLADMHSGVEKRKFNGSYSGSQDEIQREQGSPPKKTRVDGPKEPRFGLGIQYSR
ncbi:unnamed protein product [Clonostachys rhizophaga]|uniref:FAD-dependent oxidoreductase-like enzyme n=1 Tax=Clonostachys rhizophaga TaxID=160324 RepID=A0A9N9ZAM2_9HYPO|nr:unnamed protein product [Clonostachys rhizophaga]